MIREWMDDKPVAMVDDTGTNPAIYYIHTDEVNRPQKLTDVSDNIAWDGVFDPFGNTTSISGSVTMLLMFPGQYYDSETQLSQNWHRDYDPTIGRYIQSDPIGLWGGINTYSYVSGNPIEGVDPLGLWATGFSLGFSYINPFTSGGGGSFGLNLEYTSNCGWNIYGYGTPENQDSNGFSLGFSAQANVATGSGNWSGPFQDYMASYGLFGGSYFQSPTGQGNWQGLSFGFSAGPPGAADTTTNYTNLTSDKCGCH